jgi:hypothetical protein
MKKKGLFLLALGMVCVIVDSGCGGVPTNNNTTTTTGTTSGNVVTSNITTTDPWTSLSGQSNVTATMRVNDSGVTVTEIPCTILTASVTTVDLNGLSETGVDDLYCIPGNSRGVFEGDSGSPVLVNENIAGGLFGSSDGTHFDARGIAQMEATQSGTPRIQAQMRRIPARYHFEAPAALMPVLMKRPGMGNAVYEGPVVKHAIPRIPASAFKNRPEVGGGGVPLIPGLRFCSPFVSGPYVIGYDMATLTIQLTNGDWVATGHGLEDAGTVSWPVMSVSVLGTNSDGTVHANPIGSIYGTLLWDGQDGSVIDPTTPASMMPVTVNVTFNSSTEPVSNNQVRFDLGSSTEDSGIEAAAQSTVQEELAAVTTTLSGSGTVVLGVAGAETTSTLTFASGETLSGLVSNIGTQIDQILTTQHTSAPTSQIQTVTINLTLTSP